MNGNDMNQFRDAVSTLPAVQDMGQDAAGVMALAYLPDKDFDSRLEAMQKGLARVRRIQDSLMVRDEDFGVIPGTKKATLLKPGAEKLCAIYRLVPTFDQREIIGDGASTPDLRVVTKCQLHLGSSDGPIVGEGVGAANTWEKKYHYRMGERSCPVCEKEGSVLKSKKKPGDWFCWAKKGGCGMEFQVGSEQAQAIESQVIGMVVNPDPYDFDNTCTKMSAKRAYIDATLRATATSGLFTQDMEDVAQNAPPDETKPKAKPKEVKDEPVMMTAIEELHGMIHERTKTKSWAKTLEYCRITPPARWTEPATVDEARITLKWLTASQGSTIRRTLLQFKPVGQPEQVDDGDPTIGERQPGDEPPEDEIPFGRDINQIPT